MRPVGTSFAGDRAQGGDGSGVEPLAHEVAEVEGAGVDALALEDVGVMEGTSGLDERDADARRRVSPEAASLGAAAPSLEATPVTGWVKGFTRGGGEGAGGARPRGFPPKPQGLRTDRPLGL